MVTMLWYQCWMIVWTTNLDMEKTFFLFDIEKQN